jgi:glycosyltransferase involved in cell wall biosynthesis
MSFLLSICIPTKNRSSYLVRTLESIVSQEVFKKEAAVQIVISDNCSTDNTEIVVRKFIEKYPDKIKYFKNIFDVVDLNFELALRRGDGEFLKLINDNVLWAPKSLEYVINLIKISEKLKPVLFFLNGARPSQHPVNIYGNVNDFLASVSFNVTWIGCFGIWREHLMLINDFSRKLHTQLVQVDVILRLINQGIPCCVDNLRNFLPDNSMRKGGYSIAKVFGKNYLDIVSEYIDSIHPAIFNSLKKDVFIWQILHYHFDAGSDFFGYEFDEYLDYFKNEPYFDDSIHFYKKKRESELNNLNLKNT